MIHGDVIISKRPRWISHDVLRDQKIFDYISACFSGPLKQESMMENADTSYELSRKLPGPFISLSESWPPHIPTNQPAIASRDHPLVFNLSNEHQGLMRTFVA
ncbi:hypothetical protein OROGR_028765 [Orobanche gracilis]